MSMQKYKVIDMEHNPRRAHFDHFRSMQYPYVGVTAEVDITEWLAEMKKKGNPFFLSFLYAAARAGNSVPEFRRRILDDQCIEYETCIPSFTVALEDESYCYCKTDAALPFEEYLAYSKAKQKEAMEHPELDDGEDFLALFFISSVPWISFIQLTHPVPYPADSNPRISWGKYHTVNGRVMIPVNLQCNHALVDGLHLAKYFEQLEAELKQMMK